MDIMLSGKNIVEMTNEILNHTIPAYCISCCGIAGFYRRRLPRRRDELGREIKNPRRSLLIGVGWRGGETNITVKLILYVFFAGATQLYQVAFRCDGV